MKNETKLFVPSSEVVQKVIPLFQRIKRGRWRMAKMIYDSAPDPVSTPDEMENVSSTSKSKIKK